MDISLIRAAYPTPMRGLGQTTSPQGSYCVGGALCAFYELVSELALIDLFPDKYTLTDALLLINPLLTYPLASSYARRLIVANDDGDFAYAWRVASEAVNYQPEGD